MGGSAKHQRLMLANLVASLVAAERIVTTEAKAKAMRPVAEKVITKASKGGLHNHRQLLAFLGDTEIVVRVGAWVWRGIWRGVWIRHRIGVRLRLGIGRRARAEDARRPGGEKGARGATSRPERSSRSQRTACPGRR